MATREETDLVDTNACRDLRRVQRLRETHRQIPNSPRIEMLEVEVLAAEIEIITGLYDFMVAGFDRARGIKN